jgi:di/tricarboxylate transporter
MPVKKTKKDKWMGIGFFLILLGLSWIIPSIMGTIGNVSRGEFPFFAFLLIPVVVFIVAGVICWKHGFGIVIDKNRPQANSQRKE